MKLKRVNDWCVLLVLLFSMNNGGTEEIGGRRSAS